ncbi:MAG: hypothetical protein HYU51_18785 [Candidatus Rokubacteria bacterium]|nr:hypothetical protein [Candidatus Rokubacteria bacterium]
MKVITIAALGTLLLAAASTASAQAPSQTETPRAPNPQAEILLRLLEPARPALADSLTRDDLEQLPPPRPDTLKDTVRVHVIVTDPRCLPGDDLFNEPLPGRRPSRRR